MCQDRLEFLKKYRDEPQMFWDTVSWTDGTKINLYQSDKKAKVFLNPPNNSGQTSERQAQTRARNTDTVLGGSKG